MVSLQKKGGVHGIREDTGQVEGRVQVLALTPHPAFLAPCTRTWVVLVTQSLIPSPSYLEAWGQVLCSLSLAVLVACPSLNGKLLPICV